MPDIVIISPGESIPLDPTSSAFAYGFGLFETMRYADGKLYFWREHWERLSQSAERFALALPKEAAVLAALVKLVADSDLQQAALKLSLVKLATGSRLYVYSRPPLPAPAGRRLLLDTTCPIFPRSLLAGHKTHNYMETMHLLSLARERGYYDILRVDSHGNLAETTTANLFFIKDSRIHTPSLDTGILPGVTRAALLSARGLEIIEGCYSPDSLLEAEAVFITNATHGLKPIERIDGFYEQETACFAEDDTTILTMQEAYAQRQIERAVQVL